ncbi:alpha/beta hydrolase [Cytophagales bacterium LB-30]|uniref:Alpha/beta hydrolase n=1 Tax=Shiella aurantiaca TaxID=3058365 RepID=A0ABT8F353_9BACT|nr:alpha/beta hydrolase [Shiella aurantiaca]MDN4164436.1 alpha/beta hydrolase [Shiella aurantiaca]
MKRFLLLLGTLVALVSLTQAQYTPAFRVDVIGQGQPIILIPGYSCSGAVWKETVDQLKGRYECHVVTLAGFAGVPAIESPILETVKNELIAYTREQQLSKPILIGHSLGAFMSLWLSSEAPELFGKVIAVDGVPFISSMFNPAMTADSMRRNPQLDPELVVRNFKSLPSEGFIERTAQAMLYQVNDTARARQIATWQFESDRSTLGLTLIEISTTDLRKAISRIQAPVLVLGSIYNNKETSERILGQQYAAVPHKTIKIADSKHFIMYDQAKWFYQEISAFLTENE